MANAHRFVSKLVQELIQRGAYLLAKPLRANRALAIIVLDRLVRKVPKGLYWRLHLAALFTWFARPAAEAAPARRQGIVPAIRERSAKLSGQGRLIALFLAVNAAVLTVSAVLYSRFDASWALSEFGLWNTFNVMQLLAAGTLGILAFRSFWRAGESRTPAESAGIFLWGAVGIGLVGFAFDDFFGVHEALGGWIDNNIHMIPLFTNHADDFITLAYGVVGLALLACFRHELFAVRASSTLLVVGVVAAALMLAADAYAQGPLTTTEFPLQAGAVSLLLLATLTRYQEVCGARVRAARPADSKERADSADAVQP